MSALELHDVRKIYRSGDEEVVALDHAQLTIGDDEMVALVGPSGSGKTTLISIAGGLLRPTDGSRRGRRRGHHRLRRRSDSLASAANASDSCSSR